jgi:hypothetical protein
MLSCVSDAVPVVSKTGVGAHAANNINVPTATKTKFIIFIQSFPCPM